MFLAYVYLKSITKVAYVYFEIPQKIIRRYVDKNVQTYRTGRAIMH